jgi:hypothetical protein
LYRGLTCLALFVTILVPSAAFAQDIGLGFGRLVSPGDLAADHKEWDSITKCIECHNLQGGVSDEKCLDCHKELNQRLRVMKGYHAHITVRTVRCVACHKDHKGRGYDMIAAAWPKGKIENFDHAQTGYTLEDRHAQIKCETCHDKKTEKGDPTYLGLGKTCVACHKDIHEKSLGDTCADCHINARSFKGQDVRFDHAKADYPLEGKHVATACEKCHKGTSKERAIFKVEDFQRCVTCHRKADIHKNGLGDRCESCHTAEDWKKAVKFDHGKTGYPLVGKHRETKCGTCHPNAKQSGNFKLAQYGSCGVAGCHAEPERGGTVHAGRIAGEKCERCHTAKGWADEIFDHNDRKFNVWRLKGKHADVKCASCHPPTGKVASYKQGTPIVRYDGIDTAACAAPGCHAPATKSGMTHGAQFVGEKCERCHAEQGWKPTTFRHDDQGYGGFKLKGKHAEVKCDGCHTEGADGRATYRPIDSKRCANAGCHDNVERGAVHGRQFADRDCASCHTEQGWKPTLFKHEEARYKLHGKHVQVKCEKCHKPNPSGAVAVYDGKAHPETVYKPIDTASCSSSGCHKDAHGGLLKGKECAECHVVDDWKKMDGGSFDHTEDTHYALVGKHRTTDCVKCHVKGEDGKARWKPVAMDCYGCHKKDDKHKGAYGEKCFECHSVGDWNPIPAAHDQTAFPLTGTHKQLVCVDCHTKGNGDFSGLSPDCQQCHSDPHMNQMGRFCSDCHTMINWEPTRFNHSLTGFRLEGGHRFAACRSCHEGRFYRTRDSQCLTCHVPDFIRGTPFHVTGAVDCERCHTVYNWAPAREYAHRVMTFTGAHAVIKRDCANCHVAYGSFNYGQKFPGASSEQDCYTCHATDYARIHPSGWSTTCVTCHGTTTWSAVRGRR